MLGKALAEAREELEAQESRLEHLVNSPNIANERRLQVEVLLTQRDAGLAEARSKLESVEIWRLSLSAPVRPGDMDALDAILGGSE